jgi:hypothetical protein
MQVNYLHGYYPEEVLEVVEIRHIINNDEDYHILVTSDGKQYPATAFTLEVDQALTAWLPENW